MRTPTQAGRRPLPAPIVQGAYDVFDDPVPAQGVGVDNAAVHHAVDIIAPVLSGRRPRKDKVQSTKWGLYWESHRVWRDYINNRLKKKKGKALKARPPRAGFYYENEDDWRSWKAARDIDAHYKPRVLLHHQHVSHDRIHDNIDIHTGHHMLEAYVHLRATKKNILYLAHVLREQKGRLYTIGDKHKPKFLMDLHEGDKYSEEEIVALFPKRKPFAILLRYHHHHDHGFTGGSLWKSPEYIEHFHSHPSVLA